MSKAFNDNERDGGVYALSEDQKINNFECRMKVAVYIS